MLHLSSNLKNSYSYFLYFLHSEFSTFFLGFIQKFNIIFLTRYWVYKMYLKYITGIFSVLFCSYWIDQKMISFEANA